MKELRSLHNRIFSLKKCVFGVLCMALMICGLYHEPVSVHTVYDPYGQTISGSVFYEAVEAEPEPVADKTEEIVNVSVRTVIGRTVLRRFFPFFFGISSADVEVLSFACIISLFATCFSEGIYNLFRNVISFIWSQIGL